jgi:hypothetical protein
MSLREAVRAAVASPLPTQTVAVDGLGEVVIKVLSAAELAHAIHCSKAHSDAGRAAESLAAFVAAGLFETDGRRAFDPAAATDLALLAGLRHDVLKHVETAIIKLNKLGDSDHEAARKN